MPGRIEFTKSDLSFIERYLNRIKQQDQSLKYSKALFKVISTECKKARIGIFMTTKCSELNSYEESKAVDLANNVIVPLLSTAQRTALSKARYAYYRKKNNHMKKTIEIDHMTSDYLDQMIDIIKKFSKKHQYCEDLKLTKKIVLRKLIYTFYMNTFEYAPTLDTEDVTEYMLFDLIDNIKNSEEFNKDE